MFWAEDLNEKKKHDIKKKALTEPQLFFSAKHPIYRFLISLYHTIHLQSLCCLCYMPQIILPPDNNISGLNVTYLLQFLISFSAAFGVISHLFVLDKQFHARLGFVFLWLWDCQRIFSVVPVNNFCTFGIWGGVYWFGFSLDNNRFGFCLGYSVWYAWTKLSSEQ